MFKHIVTHALAISQSYLDRPEEAVLDWDGE